MEMIKEEEEIKQEDLELREWMENNEDKISNMVDPYYEL